MVNGNLRAFMLNDLKKSNLTPKDANRLRITPVSAEALDELVGRSTAGGYEIPYADFKGKPIAFSRYKLVAPVSFGRSTMRYWQPPKSAPKLYIPALVDWRRVLADPGLDVWITEGEKKAASLCALGMPCVAVSGVWAWTSKKFQQALVPELKELASAKRKFILCFDSDVDENPQIKGALSALATTIERLGASVVTCQLPIVRRGQKTGLDDFIVHHKKNAFKELVALDKEPNGLSRELNALNGELEVVKQQQQVYIFETQRFATPRSLVDIVMSDRTITTYDRAGNAKQINAAAEWLKWPKRRVVSRLAYEPGEPEEIQESNGVVHNLWKGWGVEPKRGDTRLFDELVAYMGKKLTPTQRTWWLQWMAYPIQHPGAKMYSAVVIYSHHQGTGKTLLGYTLGRIYDKNYVEVDQEQLHAKFNSWAHCKQFVVGDEITGYDKRADANKLKSMITRAEVNINEKYQPEFRLPDVCNYYLTTNQPDAMYVEETDRRFFIVEVEDRPLPKSFYDAYDKWYRTNEAIAAIFYRLMRVDLKGFNHQAQPPHTEAKEAMRLISGSESDGIVREFLAAPDIVLKGKALGRELLSLPELQSFLDPTGRLGTQQIGRSMRRLGCPKPVLTRVAAGNKTLYAIKNWERWAAAGHHERAKHYDAALAQRSEQRAKVTKSNGKANGAAHAGVERVGRGRSGKGDRERRVN